MHWAFRLWLNRSANLNLEGRPPPCRRHGHSDNQRLEWVSEEQAAWCSSAYPSWWRDSRFSLARPGRSTSIGLGVAATVVAMCSPLGPLVAIAVAAGGSAALAGGMSIQSNKGKDGRVDWGAVGVDALIGGAAGALGGATSFGLSKAVPAMARSSVNILARAGSSRVLGPAGQSAIPSAVQGAGSNAADYGVKTGWSGDAGGYFAAAGTGAATGAGFSAASSVLSPKLGSALIQKMDLGKYFPSNVGPHIASSGLSAGTQTANALATKAFDSVAGGLSSIVNESIRPGGDTSGDNIGRSFISDFIDGAEGPDVHRASGAARKMRPA